VGHVEDALEGAVVPLEPHDGGAGEDAREVEDVAHLGPAEAVDRLVVVADDAEVGATGSRAGGAGEEAQELELGDVRVLVLVDEDHAEALAGAEGDCLVLAQEPRGEADEVAEVDVARAAQALLVGRVDAPHELGVREGLG